MIQIGNYKFEDAALSALPKAGQKGDIGKIASFKTQAIGPDGPMDVLVTYEIGMRVSAESEADIDARLSSIDAQRISLDEEKLKKLANKDKLK